MGDVKPWFSLWYIGYQAPWAVLRFAHDSVLGGSTHSAHNSFVTRRWGIVCSTGAAATNSDDDDDSSDDDGLNDRNSRSKVVLPEFDGTVENWMSWHVACMSGVFSSHSARRIFARRGQDT